MAAKCAALTKAGKQCHNVPLAGRNHCLMHDPALSEMRREAGRTGGRHRASAARAAKLIPAGMDAAELHGRLSALFTSTMAGTTEPKVATAAAALARMLLEAAREAQQPTIDELQEQLDLLRQMIERGHVA